MPHPIASSDILDVAVTYLAKRQLQGRPTTERQINQRVGLGTGYIQGLFEKHGVQYLRVGVGDKSNQHTTEMFIVTLPENIALRNGFTVQQIEESYENTFRDLELETVGEAVDGIDPDELMLSVDPYAPFRITTAQYQAIKHELIDFNTLVEEGKKRGYTYRAIERATGGDRMKYKLPSVAWRPYVYRKKRYYLREVLNQLEQVYRTYKSAETAALKRKKRNKALSEQGEGTTREELWSNA